MKFRKAISADLEIINEIFKEGSRSLGALGVDQWQGSTVPVAEDEKGFYVLEDGEEVTAVALIMDYDPQYDMIYDGQWNYDENYVAVHKLATKITSKRKGYGSTLLREIEKLAMDKGVYVIRIDTHRDNLPMNNLLIKQGYKRAGRIELIDGGKRVAYDKKLI
ncbi:MAG: GNAT family N-acetyltransferase [Peptoniphilus sp.]|nr:GNAT family N-acetyltransferase [Peptoniphilus sp.]